ncbi:MAG: hypothetical protein VX867_04975, partial [Pseudomonadota bacterium]|nr:hypothetical protein [Pseudomonadota bacterium]
MTGTYQARRWISCVVLLSGLLATSVVQAEGSRIRNRTISYVMTDLFWSVYQTEDAQAECPKG